MKYILALSIKTNPDISAAIVFACDNFKSIRDRFYKQKKTFNYPALVVVDENMHLLGILTEKDIIVIEKRTDINSDAVRAVDVCNKNAKYISEAELKIHKQNNTDPFEGLPASMSFMPVVDDKNCFEKFVYNIRFYQNHLLYLVVDILDSCQLQCPYCPRGTRWMKNSRCEMNLDTFGLVIKKAKEYNVTSIDLSNWTEVFLKRDVYRFMEVLRENDIPIRCASSNFSLAKIPNFDRFLESEFTRLYVSVSGFTQKTYEKYHRNGNLEYVKRNLEYAADYMSKHKIDSDIIVRYLDFGYNKDEVEDFRAYACQLGISFEWRKGFSGISQNPPICETNRTISMLQYYHNVSCAFVDFNVCEMFKTFALDCEANAYLCCCKPNYGCTKIGNFLKDSYEDIMLNKFMNPVCRICPNNKTYPLPERVKAHILRKIN